MHRWFHWEYARTRCALNGMHQVHLVGEICRNKGERVIKRAGRKLPLISQWLRGRVIDTPG